MPNVTALFTSLRWHSSISLPRSSFLCEAPGSPPSGNASELRDAGRQTGVFLIV